MIGFVIQSLLIESVIVLWAALCVCDLVEICTPLSMPKDDRFQSHPFEALQKHLKVTVAGCSSSLKQEEASHSLSAAPHSGHCHRKTRKKHHGKIGKLRKPPKNT